MNKHITRAVAITAFFAGLGSVTIQADTVIQKKHVINFNPAQQAGLTRAPWSQIQYHSTANPNGTMQGERLFMGRNWINANYTHIVGWNYETGRAESWEIMPKGGSYSMGGIDNWEGWASIEFSENIPNAEAFKQAYQVYIDTGRQLADEIGVSYDLDDGTNIGMVTHNHSSKVGRGSDHTDPLGFLAKWGVSYDQFKLDLKTGKAFSGAFNDKNIKKPIAKPKAKPKPAPKPVFKESKAIKEFKKHGNIYYATKTVRVDKVAYVHGMYQFYSNELAGGTNGTWLNNGVALSMVDNVTRGNVKPTQVGDKVKIMVPYNYGTIDKYDIPSKGVGIKMGHTGLVWMNADTLYKL